MRIQKGTRCHSYPAIHTSLPASGDVAAIHQYTWCNVLVECAFYIFTEYADALLFSSRSESVNCVRQGGQYTASTLFAVKYKIRRRARAHIAHRCDDGRFPVSASCLTISNPGSPSSSETGVNPGIRS
jgi:hypothetical protein